MYTYIYSRNICVSTYIYIYTRCKPFRQTYVPRWMDAILQRYIHICIYIYMET